VKKVIIIILLIVIISQVDAAENDLIIDLQGAFDVGFVSINITGKEDGNKFEVEIHKEINRPFNIILDQGLNRLNFLNEKVYFYLKKETQLDFSTKQTYVFIADQIGKYRIESGSVLVKKKSHSEIELKYDNFKKKILEM